MSQPENKAEFSCSNCGAALDVQKNQEYVKCSYCGTKFSVAELLEESEAVKIQKIKSQAYKETEAKRIRVMEMQEKNRYLENTNAKFTDFMKKITPYLLFIPSPIILLIMLYFFSNGYMTSGVLTALQMIFLILGILIGFKIIKTKTFKPCVIMVVLAMALIVPILGFSSGNPEIRGKTINWNDFYLGNVVPSPNRDRGEVFSDDSHNLNISVFDYTSAEYRNYLEKVKDAGFVEAIQDKDYEFKAFNKEGFSVRTYHFDDKLNIDILAPISLNPFIWPEKEVRGKLPKPHSDKGEIRWCFDGRVNIIVGETSLEQYQAYVEKVKANGFSDGEFRDPLSFSGKDWEGYTAKVTFDGFNGMTVELFPPDY